MGNVYCLLKSCANLKFYLSEEAITGLRNEIFSLNAARGPLDKLIAGLKETLQAAEFVDKFEDAREQFAEYRKVILILKILT